MSDELLSTKQAAQPWYGAADPFHLIAVDRAGYPPLEGGTKPILAMRFYFQRLNEDLPFYITFLMDPDGAVEEYLADDSHVDTLFAHFSPETPAEPTEESNNG